MLINNFQPILFQFNSQMHSYAKYVRRFHIFWITFNKLFFSIKIDFRTKGSHSEILREKQNKIEPSMLYKF